MNEKLVEWNEIFIKFSQNILKDKKLNKNLIFFLSNNNVTLKAKPSILNKRQRAFKLKWKCSVCSSSDVFLS